MADTKAEGLAEAAATVAAAPAQRPLLDVPAATAAIVARIRERVATCRSLPPEALRGDITAVTRDCVELAVAMLGDPRIEDGPKSLSTAGTRWARECVPIDAIHHAISEGVRVLLERVVAEAGPNDTEAVDFTARRLITLSSIVSGAVSSSYLHELRVIDAEHYAATHAVASALLSGRGTQTVANKYGIHVAPAYFVIALVFSPQRPQRAGTDWQAHAVRTELRRRAGDALSLPFDRGATILLPTTFGDDGLGVLVERLATAAGCPATAVVLQAPTTAVPHSYRHAHELLEMVLRLRRGPGLYRLADVALDYQLTRPGPARQSLLALVDPLRGNPELLQTLREYLACGLNRKQTARRLYVHQNTVGNRLRKIAELTGIDPLDRIGVWRLRSALVAQAAASTPEPTPEPNTSR